MLYYLAVWDLVTEKNVAYNERKETIEVARESLVEGKLRETEQKMTKPIGGHRYVFRTLIKL
jgi:hypothetical protein